MKLYWKPQGGEILEYRYIHFLKHLMPPQIMYQQSDSTQLSYEQDYKNSRELLWDNTICKALKVIRKLDAS